MNYDKEMLNDMIENWKQYIETAFFHQSCNDKILASREFGKAQGMVKAIEIVFGAEVEVKHNTDYRTVIITVSVGKLCLVADSVSYKN